MLWPRYTALLLHIVVRAWAVQFDGGEDADSEDSFAKDDEGQPALAKLCLVELSQNLGKKDAEHPLRSIDSQRLTTLVWLQWLSAMAARTAQREFVVLQIHIQRLWAGMVTTLRRAAIVDTASLMRQCFRGWRGDTWRL